MNNIVINNPVDLMNYVKPKFNAIYGDSIKFEEEKSFAVQAFNNNPYLMSVARSNPMSAVSAISNLAAMDLTLNPARKFAYLVPRGGDVCLDVSYMGLLASAIQDGSCIMGKCNIVYSSDEFLLNGIDNQPTHTFNPFEQNRGDIIGCYAVLKLNSSDYYTETMPIKEINKIKNINVAVKTGKKSAWDDFGEEMMKKVVLKRALKFVKGKSPLSDNIVEYLNKNGEGIEFADRPKERLKTVTEMLSNTQEKVHEIAVDYAEDFKNKLEKLGIFDGKFQDFLSFSQIDIEDTKSLKDMLEVDGVVESMHKDYMDAINGIDE